jgi:predicted transcriptional regulator
MIEINGLTDAQVAMLDEMWACDTLADFEEFLEALDPEDRKEALRLQRMILLAELDEVVAKMPLTEVQKLLAQFRL